MASEDTLIKDPGIGEVWLNYGPWPAIINFNRGYSDKWTKVVIIRIEPSGYDYHSPVVYFMGLDGSSESATMKWFKSHYQEAR